MTENELPSVTLIYKQLYGNLQMGFIIGAELFYVISFKWNSTFTLHCNNFFNLKTNLATFNTLHIKLNHFTNNHVLCWVLQ